MFTESQREQEKLEQFFAGPFTFGFGLCDTRHNDKGKVYTAMGKEFRPIYLQGILFL